MENNKNKSTSRNTEMDNFAVSLFNSLKEYGYVFPKTEKDVEKFEKLYGNTEIETPVVKLPISNDDSDFSSGNFNFQMAAYSSSDKSGFIIPKDLEATKSSNKKKKK